MWYLELHDFTLTDGYCEVTYFSRSIESPFRPVVGDRWLVCPGILVNVEEVVWQQKLNRLLIDLGGQYDVKDDLQCGLSWSSLHSQMTRYGWGFDEESCGKLPEELNHLLT